MRRLVLPALLLVLALLASSAAAMIRPSADTAGSCVFLPFVGGGAGTASTGSSEAFAGCATPAAPPLGSTTTAEARPTGAPAATATASATSSAQTTSTATPSTTTTTEGPGTATPSATSTATSTTAPTENPTASPTTYAEIESDVRLLPESAVRETTRRPVRLTLVLDVSGSMSANFSGQCDQSTGGQPLPPKGYWQCVSVYDGSPPAELEGTGPDYFWGKVEERRIYVAKQALERLVRQLNLPGNPGYRPEFPPDEVSLVWFNHGSGPDSAIPYSSDVSALITSIGAAGSYNGDPYRSIGASNIAAGLYRASVLLNAAPETTAFGGRTYGYRDHVVLLTDSVANTFLSTDSLTLNGGPSMGFTYPADHPCRSMPAVRDHAPCQTTEVGGQTTGVGGLPPGMDRPITQAVQVSHNRLQPRADVLVSTLGPISSLGLRDGVASSPAHFFSELGPYVLPDGTTSIDRFVDDVLYQVIRVETNVCVATTSTEWVTTVPPQHMPQTPLVTPPAIGKVLLKAAGSDVSYEVPITVRGSGNVMTYSISHVPPGTYTMSAYVFYRGDDGQTRQYSWIEIDGWFYESTEISWTGRPIANPPLSLRFMGDVCTQGQ